MVWAMCHACWFVRMHCIVVVFPFPRCRCQLYWPENHKALCVQCQLEMGEWERGSRGCRDFWLPLTPSLSLCLSVYLSWSFCFVIVFFFSWHRKYCPACIQSLSVARFDFPLHDYNPFSLTLSFSLSSFQFWVLQTCFRLESCSLLWKIVYKLTGSKQDLLRRNRKCLDVEISRRSRRKGFPRSREINMRPWPGSHPPLRCRWMYLYLWLYVCVTVWSVFEKWHKCRHCEMFKTWEIQIFEWEY